MLLCVLCGEFRHTLKFTSKCDWGGRKRELTLLAPLLTLFTLRAIATVVF